MPVPVDSIRSFHRRRIAIPVTADDLVLDVGSGDKPHWRADVLVDRYIDAAHAGQRSGRVAARVDRPLFEADATALPFADGAFDFVVCSHVLEHVADPAAVAAELARVATAGYIEVPEAASAKILDFPSHLWWCRRDGHTLRFTAKQARAYDPEIGAYIARAGIERRLAKLLDRKFDHRVTSLSWVGSIDISVDGSPDPEFVAAALGADTYHQVGQSYANRVLTWAFTLPLRHGPRAIARRRPIELDAILRPELRRGSNELLKPRVYRI